MLRRIGVSWQRAAALTLGAFNGLGLGVLMLAAFALTPLNGRFPGAGLRVLTGAYRLTDIEANRFSLLTGEQVGSPSPATGGHSPDERLQRLLDHPGLRRLRRYALLRFPLSCLELVLLTLTFTWPLLILVWLVRISVDWFPGGFGRGAGTAAPEWLLTVPSGVGLATLIVVVTPRVVDWLVRIDAELSRLVLGEPELTALTDRVGDLVTSRARAVSAADAER